jgi:hypothetical protein
VARCGIAIPVFTALAWACGPQDAPRVCDLAITEVAFYQGVKITLVKDGVVPPRAVEVVAGRPALVRVFVRPGPLWDGETATATVTVKQRLAQHNHSATRALTGGAMPRDGDLSTTFNTRIDGARLAPDSSLAVAITEPASCAANVHARWPLASTVPLEARKTGKLNVRFVPIKYMTDGSGRLPDTSAQQIGRYRNLLMALFPVDAVSVTQRDPVVTGENFTVPSGWMKLLDALRALRALRARSTLPILMQTL